MLNQQPYDTTGDLDAMAKLVSVMLPVYEIDSIADPFMLFTRFYIFLSICIPRLPEHLRRFDPAAEFEKAFGFPLKRYYLAVFIFMLHGRQQRDKSGTSVAFGEPITQNWLKGTNLSPVQVHQLFSSVSFSLSDLPDTKAPIGFADFEFLRDKPYFNVNGELHCLDYEYAVSKLESGVIWRVRSTLPEKERLAYFSFWGDVFEEYVQWLFEEYANQDLNVFFRSPKLLGSSLCDAIVVCGTAAVLIEVKLGTCAANIRYSGNHQRMRKFLEDHLVTGTKRKVGVQQLVTAIGKIAGAKKHELPGCLQGVKKLIPCL